MNPTKIKRDDRLPQEYNSWLQLILDVQREEGSDIDWGNDKAIVIHETDYIKVILRRPVVFTMTVGEIKARAFDEIFSILPKSVVDLEKIHQYYQSLDLVQLQIEQRRDTLDFLHRLFDMSIEDDMSLINT